MQNINFGGNVVTSLGACWCVDKEQKKGEALFLFLARRVCRLCVCRIVGDGFIRPEIRTFVNSGRITSINAEQGNLGTDKSVPYENPANAPHKNPATPYNNRNILIHVSCLLCHAP